MYLDTHKDISLMIPAFLSNKPLTPQGNSGPINISKSRHPQMARNTDSHEYFPHHESQAKRFAPFSKPFDDRRLDTTRQRARQTLQELISHKIGFNQLVTENIDSALLKELYSEIGVDVPVTSPSSSMAHTSIQDNGVKSPKTLKKRNEDTIGSDNSLGNLELPNASMVSNDTREHSIQQAVDQQPESQHRPSKPLTPDKNILVDTIPKPAKAITSRPQATAPQGNSPFQKPSALPPSDKALERKDYIARMLAARAGKSVSATKSPKQSSNPRTEIGKGNAPKSASAKVFDTSVSPEQAASSPHTMEVDLESKKKAQTELALQKIEALKTRKANEERANQATVSHSQVTSSQAATPAASPQVNSITLELTSASKQYQTTVMPETAGDPSTTVPFSRISPPPSLFSPFGKKAMFGIPGLFMSSAQPVSVPQVTQSPSLQTTITSVPPSLGQHPPSFTTPPMRSPLVAASNVPINASPPQTLPPSGQADTASPDAEPFSGSRKRARAVDFIDSLSDRVNKRLDSGKDTEVFIGDSDDEETETIENGATEFKTSPKPAKPFESVNGSRDQPKPIRDLPPLSDFPPKPKPGAKATLQTPPIVQVPVKDKDKEDLKQKEQEIQLMQRKIQELEQRRKAKQTASRAETPVQQGVVAPQTAPQSSALRQSKSSDKTEEPLQAVDRYLELQKASLAISEVVIQDQLDELDVRKQAKANEIAKAEAENVTARNAITVAEMELRQRRKADIEAGLPQLDAQVERTRLRLEILRNQIEELESDMQKGLKGRQDLLEELQTLDEVQEDVVDYKEHLVTQGTQSFCCLPYFFSTICISSYLSDQTSYNVGPHTSESSHLAESSTLGEKLETESPSITGKHLSPSQSAQSISANRVDLADTETVHSVMSISSNSTDDGEITDCNPQSLVHSQASPDVNSLQEDHIQDLDTGISPSQETFTRNLQPSINDLAGRVDESVLPNSVESTMIMGNRASHTPEDLQGYGKSPEVDAMQEEGEASSGLFPSDASDSDDYEPPDPVSPMNDEAVFSESEPFSPKSPTPPAGIALKASKTAKPVPLVKSPVDDMDEETTTRQYSAPEMKAEKVCSPIFSLPTLTMPQASTVGRAMIGDHFIPYESPLKHFKSYRYHPDYLSETSGGFRSLTYSHNIKPREPLCRWELAGGTCNDDSCDSQHFRSMGLSGALKEQRFPFPSFSISTAVA